MPPAYYDSNVESKFLLNDYIVINNTPSETPDNPEPVQPDTPTVVANSYFDLLRQSSWSSIVLDDNVSSAEIIRPATESTGLVYKITMNKNDNFARQTVPAAGIYIHNPVELKNYNYILYNGNWEDTPMAGSVERWYLYLEDTVTGASEIIELIGGFSHFWVEIPERWKDKTAYVGFIFGGFISPETSDSNWSCTYNLYHCKLV